jgi:hypothetical protein
MIHVQYWAIIVATILAVGFSALYYFLLNKQVVALRATKLDKKEDVRTTATPNKILIELVRTFVVALVIAYAVGLLNLLYINQAILLAFWLWIGFPVVLLVGSVIHEHFPAQLAAIHAGDWLAKLLIFAIILTIWR